MPSWCKCRTFTIYNATSGPPTGAGAAGGSGWSWDRSVHSLSHGILQETDEDNGTGAEHLAVAAVLHLRHHLHTVSFSLLSSPSSPVKVSLHLLLLYRAFDYLRWYRRDIRFDNIYITSYFRQIDARRRRAVTPTTWLAIWSSRFLHITVTLACLQGKRFLLPLKKTKTKMFINPRSLKIHQEELKEVVSNSCS